MASHPPSTCCTVGVKHEGTAQGNISSAGDYDVYTVYPSDESTRNAILFVTDVIGHEFINAQLIADQFAANGYFVYMPDLFAHDAVPLNKPAGYDMFRDWLPKHGPETVDPIIRASLADMRARFGCQRIGGVGYCYGARFVVRFLAGDASPGGAGLDAGYLAHPSFVLPEEIRAVQRPLSIAAAETDDIYTTEKRRLTEDILRDVDAPYQQMLYSDTTHGFAVRGDPENPRVRLAKEQAFLQAVNWFDYWVKEKH